MDTASDDNDDEAGAGEDVVARVGVFDVSGDISGSDQAARGGSPPRPKRPRPRELDCARNDDTDGGVDGNTGGVGGVMEKRGGRPRPRLIGV